MICKQCGSEYNNNDKHCTSCNADLNCSDNELAATLGLDYEANLGFAKADTPYEPSCIKDLSSGMEQSCRTRQENDTSKPLKGSLSNDNDKPSREKVHHREQEIVHKQNRRKEKKLAALRQQRLYEELKNRLQAEKQETLSSFMYQGLNQDIAEESEETTGKKRRDKSVVFSILGIFAGILMAAGILLYMGRMSEHSDYTFVAKDAIEVYTSPMDGKTYVFNAMGDLLFKLEGYQYINYTQDHTAAVLYNWNTRYCAYVNAYRKKEFSTTIYNFALSEDGNYMIYSIPGGANKFYLMLYDITRDKETMLDNQEKNFDMLNILPGGKTISYITYSLSETGSINDLQSFLIQNNSKSELFGDNMFVFGISLDLSSIYYGQFKDGGIGAVYVRHNSVDRKLSDGINGSIIINKDFSEILIEDDGSYYLCNQAEEPQKVIDQLINSIIIPEKGILNRKTNGIMRYGLESFKEKLLLCNDNSIKYLDERLQLKDIAVVQDIGSIILSKDGKNLFYIDPQKRLMKASDIKGKVMNEVLAYGVSKYEVTKDMLRIYYLREKKLYFLDKNKEERLISENVEELCMNESADTVFFLKDYSDGKGTLYYSEEGLAAVPVEGGSNVIGMKEWNFGVIYQKKINNTNAVFYNREGKDFVFILDGLDLLEEGAIY